MITALRLMHFPCQSLHPAPYTRLYYYLQPTDSAAQPSNHPLAHEVE
jgi:hypothetical protein